MDFPRLGGIFQERATKVLLSALGRLGFVVVASVALTMLVLGQIATAGFSGDDVYRTHLVAYAALHHSDLVHAIARAGDQWARERGGFFPLQTLVFALWVSDPTSGYALFVQLCMIALNVGTFVVLVRRITGSSALAWLTAACFFLALELRLTDDPVLGPLFTMPLTLECLLAALLAWTSYEASGRGRWLFASLLFFVGAVLGDAWTYPTAVCFCALALVGIQWRRAIPIACAYACVPSAALVYGYARGYSIPSAFVGHAGTVYARLFAEHVLSALPTFYRATGALVRDGVSDFGGDHRFVAISHAGISGWAIACAIALIVAGVLRQSLIERLSASCMRCATIIAASLWLSPALIPDRVCVYPMYFGVALALALILRRFWDFASGRIPERRDALAVGAGLIALFVMYGNVRFNSYVVLRHRMADLSRQHIAEAARGGLFVRLPPHASLAVSGVYPFRVGTDDYRDAKSLFYHYAHREYRVMVAHEIERSGVRPANVWYLRLNAPQQILGNPSVVAAHWSHTVGQTIFTDEAWGYREYVDEAEAASAWELFSRPARGLQGGAFDTDGRAVTVHALRRCGPVPMQDAFLPNAARITWGNGFYVPEPYPRVVMAGASQYMNDTLSEPPRRFASSQAHLFIDRDACAIVPFHVRMTVYTDTPAKLLVRRGSHTERYAVSSAGVAVDMLIPKNSSRRLELVLQTDAPHEPEMPRWVSRVVEHVQDIRMFVVAPVVVYD